MVVMTPEIKSVYVMLVYNDYVLTSGGSAAGGSVAVHSNSEDFSYECRDV